MILLRSQICCRPYTSTRRNASIRPQTSLHAVQPTRRDLLAAIAGISFSLVNIDKVSAADTDSSTKTATAAEPGSFISIAPINNEAKSFMDMRDDAMEYKCKGGMFDCDGDRRDFAKKQYQEWLDAGGVPKRIREGKPQGPRAF